MGGRSREKGSSFESVYSLSAIRNVMQSKGYDFLDSVKYLEGQSVDKKSLDGARQELPKPKPKSKPKADTLQSGIGEHIKTDTLRSSTETVKRNIKNLRDLLK